MKKRYKLSVPQVDLLFCIVLLTCVLMYGIGRIYGFIIYPDEFGYWASAARVLGYDWSKIASLGSYYSYGYSILLIPILFLFHNPVAAYRAAIVVNMFLLIGTFFLLLEIVSIIFPKKKLELRIIFSGIALFYPTWIFYMQITLAEIVLVFAFCLVSFTLLKYLDTGRMPWLVSLVSAIGFLYMIHMRTIAVMIAVCGTLLVRMIKRNRKGKQFLLFLLSLVLCLAFTVLLKRIVQTHIYSSSGAEQLAINDYAGQWSKIAAIFTKEGMKAFLVSLVGKIYYLGMSTFGTFYLGCAFMLRRILQSVREGKSWGKNFYFYLFLFLAVAGEILINAIYCKEYGRIDSLVYGRYDEFILPIVMLLGLHELFLICRKVSKCVASMTTILMFHLGTTWLLESVIETHHITNLHGGYFIPGLCYALKFVPFRPDTFFWWAFLADFILMLLVWLVFFLCSRKPGWEQVLWAIVGVEVVLGIMLCEQFTYPYNRVSYGNAYLAEELEEKIAEGRRLVSYHNTEDDVFISSLQFLLRDEDIVLVSEAEKEQLQSSDLVVLYATEDDQGYLMTRYKKSKAYGSFWLYYNP